MMTIVEFLEARIAEDEAAARTAIDPERPGTHWHWVTNVTDVVVAHGDLEDAQREQTVGLRTIEEFPTSVGKLPAFAISYAEEVDPGAGEHIARHDPARVLAECATKRAIMELHGPEEDRSWHGEANDYLWCGSCGSLDDSPEPFPCSTVKALAAVYADHPDYQQEWAA